MKYAGKPIMTARRHPLCFALLVFAQGYGGYRDSDFLAQEVFLKKLVLRGQLLNAKE